VIIDIKKGSSVTCLFGLTGDRSHVAVVAVVVFDSSHYPCLEFFFSSHIYYFPYFLTVNFFYYGCLPLITILRDEHVYPSCFCPYSWYRNTTITRRIYVQHCVYVICMYVCIYIYTILSTWRIIILYLLYRVCALS